MIDLAPSRIRGFSLVEVMVSLVILSIGLIGLAAMQASALSSTHGSQLESMVAVQARSLADAMNANPDYWNNNSPTFTVAGTAAAPTVSTNGPQQTVSCLNNICTTPTEVAGYDVQQWATQLLTQVPSATATITCSASAPVGCSIQINWTEKAAAALNNGTQNSATPINMSYTLLNQI